MEILATGGRFPASGCYALLSREADVLDLSRGMRDLCRRFRPQAEAPDSFKLLIVERDHPQLLEHLERVWRQQRSDSLETEVARTFGSPLKARIFSVPAPRDQAVQSFLSLDGCDAVEALPPRRPAFGPRARVRRAGLMVLRAEGDFDRLVVSFCDAVARAALDEVSALVDRSIFQVLPSDPCRALVSSVREAKATGGPRKCHFCNRVGTRLQAITFVSGQSVMVLIEPDPDEEASGLSHAGAPSGNVPAAGHDLEEFLRLELRPGLRALRNLARGLIAPPPNDAAGSRRLEILAELSAQMFDAVEKLDQAQPRSSALSEEADVLSRLVEGVRDVVHLALARRVQSVAVIDGVSSGTRIFSTYTLDGLQQLLVDLIGEAAGVVPHGTVTCSIRSVNEMLGRITLEFEIIARAGSSPANGPALDHASLCRRPIYKACRRFLKALGAELEGDLGAGFCRFCFRLPFGKSSALESA